MDGLNWHNRVGKGFYVNVMGLQRSADEKQVLNIQLSISNYLAIVYGRINPAMQTMSPVQICRPRVSRLACYKILAFFLLFFITLLPNQPVARA